MNKNIYVFILISFLITGCSTMADYAKNIISDPRNEKLVYKTNEDYSSGQIDLILPPNLNNPDTKNSLSLPEIVENNTEKLFTIDTKLEGIKVYKQGTSMFLSVKTQDKISLWEKIKTFWRQEGFLLVNSDLTVSSMRTNYLENLSEVQLGAIQRVVGRYVPLLVSPETRDSYKTRLIKKDDGYDILITHYGKEFMSDGDSDFRWQNRARDPEFENEMISRMYIYLGGNEARETGYIVAKSTGIRNQVSIYSDDNNLQTLYVPDIYERTYPAVVTALDILGINIIDQKQSDGYIKISLNDKENRDDGFFSNIFNKSSSEILFIKLDLGGENNSATLITIENNSFVQMDSPASEEILRGLYVKLR
ncbi:MAG: outer membrane protein assembly factor BamC [Gammaproteobacteria bacterium]|nr:outer membrane protein assembly factor BamC [Gammaproteobacteria bacterium]MBL6819580.1 outer membrane protein assembly factor BamC [Gammaproteobacteria bacterium]MBL6899119.1 outer membrane protein assembly factor BamC [Gammaproteobacteria bacterium]